MTPRERENAFRRARNEQIQARTALLVETRDEIFAQLKLAQTRIAAILADQPSDYQRWSLTNLQREITRVMQEIADQSGATMSSAAGEAWKAGQQLIDASLSAGGVRVAAILPSISIDQLAGMRAFMVERIKDLSLAAASAIRNELGLVVIGAQSPFEASKAVQVILGEDSRTRATAIVRNGISTAYATASFERLKLAAAHVPGMQKEWRKSGKLHPRPGHEAANGQTVDALEPFRIITKHGEIINMQHPHDPAAPAGEVINCGCVMLPRPPAVEARIAEAS